MPGDHTPGCCAVLGAGCRERGTCRRLSSPERTISSRRGRRSVGASACCAPLPLVASCQRSTSEPSAMGGHMGAIKPWTTITLLVGILACGQTSASQPQESANSIDRTIQQRMDEAGLVGLGAAIIIDRKL